MIETDANPEMAAAWDEEGRFWAAHADRYDRSIGRHQAHLLAAAAVGPDDVVLDVGCGNGRLTLDAAQAAATGSALGVDLSSAMLEKARERAEAEGVSNVTFEPADAQVFPFAPGSFSLAVSRFGVMFFKDPIAAFANIGRALRPGGRLVFLSWQALAKNEWILAVRDALAAGRDLPSPPPRAPGPFGLSEEAHIREVLTAAGFTDVALTEILEPNTVGTDADDAWEFVTTIGVVRGLTADLDPPAREAALAELRRVVEANAGPEGVQLGTAAWLVTAQWP